MAVRNFVSHTNGTETIDGPKGQNNKMERGASTCRPIRSGNRLLRTRPSSDSVTRSTPSTLATYGENSPRQTPFNQHGVTGQVEPAKPQPGLKGHNAAPHTKRP